MARRTTFLLLAGVTAILSVVAAPAADAATRQIAMQGFAFNPQTPKVVLGSTVKWTMDDANTQHTTTSDQSFWTSGFLSTNATFSESATFKNAGTYAYHCQVHSFMTGKIKVAPVATGSESTGWTVRWSTAAPTPANRTFDVQIMRPGSTAWASYRAATTERTAFFHPAKTGQYQFRARTHNVDNGMVSAWSPALAVTITS